ncbi:BnaAnng02580D [Brassica napus]|uniref:BnaAnng02580D protein n=1 Tax=Brassica napus TaxID=3708 RepID=A0A078G2A7_BRANA|nr:BnaAnng02580D [Brassica napus]
MSGLHSLEYFDVSENSFVGPFPTSLFTTPCLISVNLERNQFKGAIKFRNVSSSSRFQFLNFAQNNLDGPIPELISQCHNLEELHLSYNNLNGSIPKSLSKLFKLEYFCLTNNNMEGEVPSWIRRLTMVAFSNNSFNSFGTSSQVLDKTQVKWMDLSSNALQGPLPRWICKLTSIEILILSNNLLNGSIPPCLKNSTTSLTDLVLRNNSFSGTLPDIFNNATKLISLDVSRNQLEGELPKSLIHCTRLQLLNVRSNRIKDTFPFWLGPLPSLHVLILRSNKFHGPHVSTKFQSLRVIDVSHNDFTGTLPTFYFSEWLEMTTVGVEDDSFMISDVPYMGKVLNATASYISSMEIVNKGVEMEFKRINQDYKTVDFSGNRFCGNIPESIGLLKELRHLNLSGNAFTGNIPQSLGDLTKLESLDLSKNQLSGQIPQNLGGLSFVSTMNFSHNLLEGPVPRSTQFQGQSCSSFMDNLKLYGLEDICGETHMKNPVLEVPAEKEEQVVNWIAAVIAYGPGVFCGFVIGHILTSQAIYDVIAELFPVMLTPLKVSKTLPRTEKGKRDAMECFRVSPPIPKLSFFSNSRNSTSQRFIIPSCRERNRENPLSTSSPYSILGVEPNCSPLELKAAFRAKVKQYHPDVNREGSSSDVMIRRIIQAYEVLTNTSRAEIIEGECLDPFDNPECEALDVFVNEVLCFGKRCSYPCFKTASHVFSCDSTGTARAMSQGRGEDYRVQSAVNQCPRSCIHYVTPSQRIILEELLDSVLDKPYDCSAEAELLYALIVKAQFENNRYRKPKKKQPESSSKHVDWL